MNHKKIIISSVVTVLMFAISYTVSYYKTSTDGHQLTLKRSAVLEYLRENNNTSFTKESSDDIKKPD